MSYWVAILVSLVLAASTSPARAATVTAATCSVADVSTAITTAVSGDTVQIPAGSCNWNSGLTVTKNIILQGAGGGRVEGVSTSSVAIGTGSKSFTVRSGSVVSGATGWTVGETVRARLKYLATEWMEGTVTSWNGTTLVLNITSTGGSGTYVSWVFEMPATTSITHNAGSSTLFALTENTTSNLQLSGIRIIGGTGTGPQIQVICVTNGKPILIHDLRQTTNNNRLLGFNSCNRGVVYRVYMDAGFNWSKASNNLVPGYGIAVKHNQAHPSGNALWDTNSTMGVLDTTGTSNVYVEDSFLTGFVEAMDPDDNARYVLRHSVMDHASSASHGADTSSIGNRHAEYYNNLYVFQNVGSQTANVNDWLFLRGGEGVFTDNTVDNISSGVWGDKPEIKIMVENLRRNSGPYPCWGTTTPGAWPAPHQPGQGWVEGTGMTDPPAAGQTPTGFYVWNNTGTVVIGVSDYGPDNCGGGPAVSGYLQLNRDYFTSPKSGYTKYTYPHPLATASGGGPPAPSPARSNPNLNLMRP